ncbi:MAG: PilN domain-containing protein [Bacillota bacterium]
MARLNLLPAGYAPTRQSGLLKVLAVLVVIIVAGLPLTWLAQRALAQVSLRARLYLLNMEYRVYRKGLSRRTEVRAAEQALTDLKAFFSQTGDRHQWAPVLDELWRILPQGVTLESLSADGEDAVTMNGSADSLQSISQLMVAMQNSATLPGPVLRTSVRQANGRVSFHLECTGKRGDGK